MKTIGSQSLDQKLKRFVFLHWEKLVVAIAFVAIGGFCWFGYTKPYDKTSPTKLKASVEQASRHIENANSWTEIAAFRKANDQAVEAIGAEATVDYKPYLMKYLRGVKAATRGLRTDPEIKNPIEPHAQVVIGSLLIQRPVVDGMRRRDYWSEIIEFQRKAKGNQGAEGDDGGDAEGVGLGRLAQRGQVRPQTGEKKIEVVVTDLMKSEFSGIAPSKLGLDPEAHTSLVRAAVVVTGLFPHELQAKAYEPLKDAIKFNELRDQPYYVYLQVERRKRVDGKETEWEDISKYVTEDLLKNVYAATAPEIVEEQYVDPYLTVKIPPYVWVDYKSFVATDKTPVIVEKDPTATESVAVSAKSPIGIREFENKPEEDGTPKTEEEKKALAAYKLIRFFDMSLEPNEEAQYRFRVWLADPNDPKRDVYDRIWNKAQLDATNAAGGDPGGDEGASGVSGMTRGTRGQRPGANPRGATTSSAGNPFDLTDKDLDQTVRKRISERDAQPDLPDAIKFLKYARSSEWSDPTEWVRIPQANAEVVAGRVERGLQQNIKEVVYYDGEPEVNVVVKKWDEALQVQVPVPRKVMRGSVMNFRSEAKVINPIDRNVYDLKREMTEEGTAENGAKFETNAFVVDMTGGQKMPFSTAEKSYYKPSEILVMKEDGTLEVRNELGDRMEFRHGTFAEDELLTDVAPVVKEEKKEDDEGAGGRMSRGGRSGRGGR